MARPDPDLVREACNTLAKRDAALARAFDETGAPEWRYTDPCFQTLARAIAYQLLSTKAASTIWGRVVESLNNDICPEQVLDVEPEQLRGCGLSNAKVRHIRAIAEAVKTGRLCFDRLQEAPADEARKELLAVKGIGPWTADLFLMNALGHVDGFPVGDVGVMESYRLLSGAETRHESREFVDLAEAWRPYRGVAVHLLWAWINQYRDVAPR